jgi:hypothetical protein
MLELDEGKLSRPVLRRGGESNLASLSRLATHEVARLIVWHVVTRPVVPSAVSYADVRLRRESSMEECRKTSGIQGPDESLELSSIDHSMG